jgi:Leucine-rich repeat (LRR) protein
VESLLLCDESFASIDPDAFSPFTALRKLNLSGNALSDLRALSCLTVLQCLNL